MPNLKIIYLVFAAINAISAIITLYDKAASKCRKRRIKEKTLFFFSIIGGSVTMYVTMLFIRHKTKHLRFMLGLPCIILAQAALVLAKLYLF